MPAASNIRLSKFHLFRRRCHDRYFPTVGYAAKTRDAFFPIAFKFRVGDALAGRGLIKAVFVRNDADVAEAVEKH